ncbi:DNA modification methylase [bacterium (Candidatus Gribaldobacteria) CG_4_10_14_0_2_um_filter_41_16]|uniref:DNA modification methylase n=3 Tax=Candidatus Gribaldobacteria TaxID=2798536 RepID=A0A2M7VI61_9BACT|nr:MAG: DNA modification methylase [Parcubacteria group bacterium CG1_02_41_26]PIR91244.1 MAG: DNA modification methylase [bacterium (Candidatus Gribaldobacteria) CG10_big_fil_rev_8_21_14_0_10_41_12]PIV47400.1 MAG: DNA modification methylase [bacterium (Candidatus Gribaldobacteria) CG02_land_8_20_14_3_00_41_15]PJA01341.1 MAG: DNA modification methylase [bacterium (Candidatus Gribaldobacteria) CG_4_10_14_0_2_um_filter_41_16]
MTIKDLIKIYETKKKKCGNDAYKYLSKIFIEAKPIHKEYFLMSKKAQEKIKKGGVPDHEQSWRAFKGKNLEKIIIYILKDVINNLGLEVVDGNKLEKTNSANLSKELSLVKRNLLVDYGEFGLHMPDVDIIIFDLKTSKVIAVLSSKVTLRERIAQTGYWKIKLASDEATKHIKVYFVTPDEDGTLTIKKPTKKGRAIVEVDTDGSYVLSETNIEESNKVKMFDKFIDDLKKLLK